jgi:TetR/AcrR family transcriptional regulator, cholesterol catabolism regulator
MGKQSYKEREKHRRKQEILATAERLLIERGYANLNMDELAEVVGISKPTLYQHFKSKEELAAEVFIRGFRETEQFLAEPLSGPAIERITDLIRWSITKRHSAGNTIAGLRPDMIWTVLRGNPDVDACKAQVYKHMVALIDRAKEEGDIVPEIPTSIVVHSVVSMQWALNNPALQAEIAEDPARLQLIIESMQHLFLHGVTPTSGAHSNQN